MPPGTREHPLGRAHPKAVASAAMDASVMAGLVGARWLDAELAGLLWLLADARTPILVVGRDPAARDRFLAALDGLLPDGATRATVRADDDFEWLREAVELGWRRERVGERPVRPGGISSADGVLLAPGLADRDGIAGERARIVVRALTLGYGLLATMTGDGLDEAFSALGEPAIGIDDDERSRLGIVLVLAEARGRPTVVAAHYVRPVARDPHGHVQRFPPAVLATWSPSLDAWDHFAWGVLPELGDRTGLAPQDMELEQTRRSARLQEILPAKR
jgi:hypothetical protein